VRIGRVIRTLTTPCRAFGNYLDDQPWFHQLRLHDVDVAVVTIEPEWRYMAHVCNTCDYTWVR
jgi:hypothetical protein